MKLKELELDSNQEYYAREYLKGVISGISLIVNQAIYENPSEEDIVELIREAYND